MNWKIFEREKIAKQARCEAAQKWGGVFINVRMSEAEELSFTVIGDDENKFVAKELFRESMAELHGDFDDLEALDVIEDLHHNLLE